MLVARQLDVEPLVGVLGEELRLADGAAHFLRVVEGEPSVCRTAIPANHRHDVKALLVEPLCICQMGDVCMRCARWMQSCFQFTKRRLRELV